MAVSKLVEATLRLEEARKALNALLDVPEETRAEDWGAQLDRARVLVNTRQSEVLAVGAVEPEPPEHRQDTAEGRELRDMLANANIGHYFEAALGKRQIDGVEFELQRHYGLDRNALPIALLETRAAATYTGDEPNTTRPVVPQLFPQAAAAFVGVSEEQVPAGQTIYPVLTGGANVGTPDQGAAQDETTGAFAITTLTPKRIQAGFSFQIEDAAVFGSMPDSLRQNLSDALASELDKQILNRTGSGLLDFGDDPDTPTAATTAAQYLSAVYGGVDGLYANAVGEVRMLVGAGAAGVYPHMGSVAVATASDMSAAEKVSAVSGGLRVSGHVPAYASNFQDALVIKGPARRNAVAAIWQGVQLIEDRITKAAEGEIKLTSVMLFDFAILRTAGYQRHRFRTS